MTEVMKTMPTWKATERIIERAVETVREPEMFRLEAGNCPVDSQWTVDKPQIIVDQGKTYTRETHPLLFRVVDLLDEHPEKRRYSVRDLAAETSVSKSWCAVAKRYWQDR